MEQQPLRTEFPLDATQVLGNNKFVTAEIFWPDAVVQSVRDISGMIIAKTGLPQLTDDEWKQLKDFLKTSGQQYMVAIHQALNPAAQGDKLLSIPRLIRKIVLYPVKDGNMPVNSMIDAMVTDCGTLLRAYVQQKELEDWPIR